MSVEERQGVERVSPEIYRNLSQLDGLVILDSKTGNHIQIEHEKVCALGGSCVDLSVWKKLPDGKVDSAKIHVSKDNEVLHKHGEIYDRWRGGSIDQYEPEVADIIGFFEDITRDVKKQWWYSPHAAYVNVRLMGLKTRQLMANIQDSINSIVF